MAKDD